MVKKVGDYLLTIMILSILGVSCLGFSYFLVRRTMDGGANRYDAYGIVVGLLFLMMIFMMRGDGFIYLVKLIVYVGFAPSFAFYVVRCIGEANSFSDSKEMLWVVFIMGLLSVTFFPKLFYLIPLIVFASYVGLNKRGVIGGIFGFIFLNYVFLGVVQPGWNLTKKPKQVETKVDEKRDDVMTYKHNTEPKVSEAEKKYEKDKVELSEKLKVIPDDDTKFGYRFVYDNYGKTTFHLEDGFVRSGKINIETIDADHEKLFTNFGYVIFEKTSFVKDYTSRASSDKQFLTNLINSSLTAELKDYVEKRFELRLVKDISYKHVGTSAGEITIVVENNGQYANLNKVLEYLYTNGLFDNIDNVKLVVSITDETGAHNDYAVYINGKLTKFDKKN